MPLLNLAAKLAASLLRLRFDNTAVVGEKLPSPPQFPALLSPEGLTGKSDVECQEPMVTHEPKQYVESTNSSWSSTHSQPPRTNMVPLSSLSGLGDYEKKLPECESTLPPTSRIANLGEDEVRSSQSTLLEESQQKIL